MKLKLPREVQKRRGLLSSKSPAQKAPRRNLMQTSPSASGRFNASRTGDLLMPRSLAHCSPVIWDAGHFFHSRETARDVSKTNRRLQFSPWLREEKIGSTLLISCILHFTEYEEHLPIRRRTPRAEVLLLPHTRLL
jgi:hypothetical protein